MARRLVAAAAVATALAVPSHAGARTVVRAAPGPTVLGGLTRQGWPVVLAISPNTKQLRVVVIGVNMSCTSGNSFAVNDDFGSLRIGAKGKVHASASIPAVTTPNITLTGGSHAFGGTLNRRQLTFNGWWHLHLDYQLSNGQAEHCDSGRVNFSARL